MAPIGTINVVLQKETISTNLGHWNDTSSAVASTATTSAHGTGGVVTNRLRAVAAATAQAIPAWNTAPASEGWRVDVADMGAGSQRRRITAGGPGIFWTLRLRLTASVAQVSADTTVTVRLFAGVPGSMTERFRKSQAFAIGATAQNVVMICDPSIIDAIGTTGAPPQIDLAADETIQMEIYLAAPGVAIVGQTLTLTLEAAAPTAASCSRFVLPAAPIILETQDFTSASSITGADALAETKDLTSATTLTGSDALAETQDITSVASLALANETLMETGGFVSVALIGQSEAIVDPPGDMTAVSVLTALEALAETSDLTSSALLSALEALAEIGALTSIVTPTANWQLISPGLSGTVYESTGSTTQAGAQVLVFRDDTNALIATLTSNASGQWAVDLDPAFQYWVSGWKTGSPQVEDRTDRAIPTVETVIATGT